MLYQDTINLIGNTPIVRLKTLEEGGMAEIYIKLEGKNPGGSIKDRAALGMIEEAEKQGRLKDKGIIIEPTSGNTGIAISLIGKIKGYKVIVTMPDSMSIERQDILKAYGAEVILTNGALGMKGAIDKALELSNQLENSIVLHQFDNKANPIKHYNTTSLEILNDIPNLNAFVAGVGTGGTLSGIGKRLKEQSSNIQIIAVEPSNSAVLSGNPSGKHGIQGIGAGFIPNNLNLDIIDDIIKVSTEEAYETTRNVTLKTGLFLGVSSGSNIAAAIKVARKLGRGNKVLTISPDGGEKYLSTPLYRRD